MAGTRTTLQQKIWAGEVDVVCIECGEATPWRTRCWLCSSEDMAVVTHSEQRESAILHDLTDATYLCGKNIRLAGVSGRWARA